jgi:ATP-dependent exoDNAse (exonuclease V) beta subunit
MSGQTDEEVRRRIGMEFDSTFFVEAAAGTGKTTELVRRIVGLVRAGAATLDRIVAVTFTEKAAGETKLHLRSEIESARNAAGAEELARLDRALEALELTHIGTIHAFCGDLLHERPVEAGIDPLFAVASEQEAQTFANEAFDAWFENVLADPPEGVQRILRRRSRQSPVREQLRDAMNRLRDHRDFPLGWRRVPFDRDCAIDALITELGDLGPLAEASSWPEDRLAENLAEVHRFIVNAIRLETVRPRDYDRLEALLQQLACFRSWQYRGAVRTTFGRLSRDEVLACRDCAKANLDAFLVASGADFAPLLHEALQQPIAAYDQLKATAGQLDFLDLLIKTRDLIRDDPSVRHELQRRFTHYFVDEFQDTDPLQAEILLLLAADDPDVVDWRAAHPIPGKLFLVGDPVDLPVPPGGYNALRRGQSPASRRGRGATSPDEELSRAALDPGLHPTARSLGSWRLTPTIRRPIMYRFRTLDRKSMAVRRLSPCPSRSPTAITARSSSSVLRNLSHTPWRHSSTGS